MPPTYVKPCVKRQKNDTTDAEALGRQSVRPARMPLAQSETLLTSDQLILTLLTPAQNKEGIVRPSAKAPEYATCKRLLG
jgi:hypothetical protein